MTPIWKVFLKNILKIMKTSLIIWEQHMSNWWSLVLIKIFLKERRTRIVFDILDMTESL